MEQHAREHCELFAVALREEAHRELIFVEGSSASRQARVQEERRSSWRRAKRGGVVTCGFVSEVVASTWSGFVE